MELNLTSVETVLLCAKTPNDNKVEMIRKRIVFIVDSILFKIVCIQKLKILFVADRTAGF